LDILELDYKRLAKAYSQESPLLDPTDGDVTVVDSMYCSKVVQSYGSGEFGEWYRYPHHNREEGHEATINPSNPYLREDGDYDREAVSSVGNAAFDHGYLESPRLMEDYIEGAGDVYEIRTHVVRPNGNDIRNGNGTIDVALLTS